MTSLAAQTDHSGPVVSRAAAPLATIRMCDEPNRNRISPQLRSGVLAAIRQAAAAPDVRTVVLEGLPDIFCAGGSTERMLGTHQDRVVEIWELLEAIVDCPVPVVAAAGGHALGGGLLLALYADVAVFSARSRYGTNFLTYGFTPILGASYLLPAVMGRALGTEMLYTGRSYRGRELADRGAGVKVTAHDEVNAEAQRMAQQIARAPRHCLALAKSQLVRTVRDGAAAAMEREIPDHEATIATDEARRRIRTLHGGQRPRRPDGPTSASAEVGP